MTSDVKQRIDYEQIGLGLVLEDETQSDGVLVSPEEQRQRSELARRKFEDSRHPGWFDDYEFLRQQGWNWRVAAFIAWASSPKKLRHPETQMKLAQEILGLTSDRVINTWRKKNPAIDEAIALFQAQPMFEHRRDAFNALANLAATEDYKAHQDRKLFFEMTGDYVPRMKVDQRITPGVNDLRNLSDEELLRLARGAKKEKPGNDMPPGAEVIVPQPFPKGDGEDPEEISE